MITNVHEGCPLPSIHQYPFVLTAYRPLQYSALSCVKSVLQLHNETVNIWSHILGVLIFIRLAMYTAAMPIGYARTNIFAFCVGAILCFSLSTVYHIFKEHSTAWARNLSAADWVGVCILIASSHVLIAYNELTSHPLVLFVFLALIAISGLGTALILVSTIFVPQGPASSSSQAEYIFRTLICVLFALLGLVIWVVHGFLANFDDPSLWLTINFLLRMYAFHAAAVFGVVGVPERWRVGTFDILGASHQLMHIGVVLGAGTLWRGSYDFHFTSL